MQWRMLARRCPSGSMTLVGDPGQASRPGALAIVGRRALARPDAQPSAVRHPVGELPHAVRGHGGRRPPARGRGARRSSRRSPCAAPAKSRASCSRPPGRVGRAGRRRGAVRARTLGHARGDRAARHARGAGSGAARPRRRRGRGRSAGRAHRGPRRRPTRRDSSSTTSSSSNRAASSRPTAPGCGCSTSRSPGRRSRSSIVHSGSLPEGLTPEPANA